MLKISDAECVTYRYRELPVSVSEIFDTGKKVSVSVSFNILGTVTHCGVTNWSPECDLSDFILKNGIKKKSLYRYCSDLGYCHTLLVTKSIKDTL